MMKCLVCDNDIRIDTLKQLLAPAPLLLCGRCEQHLIPKQGHILFEDNEWIRSVIDQLNQGDVVLIHLFKNRLKAALQKKMASISKISIIESSDKLPYPWLEILVNEVLGIIGSRPSPSNELLIVSVVSQKNISNQISIIA